MSCIEQICEYLTGTFSEYLKTLTKVNSMRVIRHESGWDIALDMVFTDKQTAAIIAQRIRNAVHVLICNAVNTSMRVPKTADNEAGEPLSGNARAAAAGQGSDSLAIFRKRYCE